MWTFCINTAQAWFTAQHQMEEEARLIIIKGWINYCSAKNIRMENVTPFNDPVLSCFTRVSSVFPESRMI
jgi:hypothetical protein